MNTPTRPSSRAEGASNGAQGFTFTCRYVLLDIEGTTCPVNYVTETLFPYAAAALERHFNSDASDPELIAMLTAIAEAWERDPTTEAALMLAAARSDQGPGIPLPGVGVTMEQCIPYIQWLIRSDRKLTPLKSLQGRLWEEGYRTGELIATLFDDAAPAIERWVKTGLTVGSYSSGSIQAQQLLYRHSTSGDLTPNFSHWFDTTIGPKKEASSYQNITESLQISPGQVLFISDASAELSAAQQAGMQVCFSRRDGNPETGDGTFPSIQTFNSLTLSIQP